MERYVTGLLTDLPHKTADTIAAALAGTSTERLQHLLTDAAWVALALDEERVKRLLTIYPPTAGVLVFDDTGLPKKGTESVRVAPHAHLPITTQTWPLRPVAQSVLRFLDSCMHTNSWKTVQISCKR